jgi:peptide/nickel transport system substrate-binding protein
MTRLTPLAIAVVAIVASACTSTPAASGGPTSAPGSTTGGAPKILTIGESVENPTLDPTMDPIGGTDEMVSIYDTLVAQNADNSIGPDLAVSWTQDPMSITFKLRTGVKFHDGTPFNAAAVKDFLDRATTGAAAASGAGTTLALYASSTVIDDNTIKVNWKSPFSTALIDFSNDALGIPSPAAAAAGTLGNHPVGTGPFEFVEWVKGDHLTLKRNPDYTSIRQDLANKGPALVDEIIFRYSTNATTVANLLTTGAIQLTRLVGPDATRLMTSSDVQHVLLPSIFERSFPINTKHITDINVRTAIAEAIDRNAVLAASGKIGLIHYSPIPATVFGWDPTLETQLEAASPKYDPAAAKQLLAQAGYTAGSDGMLSKDGKPFTLDLLTITGDPFSAESQVVQDDLAQVGIKVNIRALDAATVLTERQKGTQDLYMGNWGILDPVPDTKYFFGCDNIPNPPTKTGANIAFYCDQDFEKVMAQAAGVTDPAQLKSLLGQAQLDIMKDVSELSLYEVENAFFYTKAVGGIEENPESTLKVSDLTLTP